MDRQHKEADESLSYAKGVLTDTHELVFSSSISFFSSSVSTSSSHFFPFLPSSPFLFLGKEKVKRKI